MLMLCSKDAPSPPRFTSPMPCTDARCVSALAKKDTKLQLVIDMLRGRQIGLPILSGAQYTPAPAGILMDSTLAEALSWDI
jgi:hypothetical protein